MSEITAEWLDSHERSGLSFSDQKAVFALARQGLAAPALLEALRAAAGYLTNAKIDLETGCTKATAIKTIEGGLARVKSAIALASPSTQTGGERK